MVVLSRVKDAVAEFVKILRFGKKDIKRADAVLPAGVDSKPVKNDLAIHANTGNDESTVCLGYIRTSNKTNKGETCIYATDQDGNNRVFELYIKNNGDIHLGGNNDFAVRFNELEEGFNQLRDEFDGHSHTYTPGSNAATTTIGNPSSTASISDAKIDNIRTP